MKRRICTLLVLVLVLCGGIACAQRAVPDFCAFSQGLVHDRTDKKHEDTKDSLRRYYEGTSDSVELAVQEYVQLLQDAYGFRLMDSYEIPQANGFDYIIFGLQSEQPEDDAIHFSVNSSAQGWEIDNCDVFVQYWKSLKGERQGVTCYINNEYVFEESGDYAKQALTKPGNATAASAPAASMQSCSTCGGDGKIPQSCTSCSGEGKVWAGCMFCIGEGGDRCYFCSGWGNTLCFSCSGRGIVRCSSCSGSGRQTDESLCSICGGDGENDCTTCSGTGRENCSSCSGTGFMIVCVECSGLGKISSNCAICKGDGSFESDCSACDGYGRM